MIKYNGAIKFVIKYRGGVIAVIAIIIAIVNHYNDVEAYKNAHFNQVAYRVLIEDYKGHNSATVIFENGDEFNLGGWGDGEVQIDDSLVKKSGSNKIMVYRNGQLSGTYSRDDD